MSYGTSDLQSYFSENLSGDTKWKLAYLKSVFVPWGDKCSLETNSYLLIPGLWGSWLYD